MSDNIVNQIGLLDYDVDLSKQGHILKRETIDITVRFPTRLLNEELAAFNDPHASMQTEADE